MSTYLFLNVEGKYINHKNELKFEIVFDFYLQ